MDEKSESEIRNLIAQGETIGAIKLFREATGAGLVHAKSAIENLERTGSLDYTAFTAETGPSESSDCVEEVTRLMKQRYQEPNTPIASRNGSLTPSLFAFVVAEVAE